MNQLVAAPSNGEIMESVIVKGDLGKLSPAERSQYYAAVCKSVGLNPLTKPFEFITLNGKLTLYALRTCTDQLRSIYKVSVVELIESERDGVAIVTAKVQNGEGRTDMAKGAVTINGLKGDALANAIMKCETKAKRRATLSICGLGFLDETEIETIPQPSRKSSMAAKRDGDWPKLLTALEDCQSAREVELLRTEYQEKFYPTWNKDWQREADELFNKRLADFSEPEHLPETLADSIALEEEVDTPTSAQVMTFGECVDWLGAAETVHDLEGRAANEGYVEGIKTLTVKQRNDLRRTYKRALETLRLASMSPLEAG